MGQSDRKVNLVSIGVSGEANQTLTCILPLLEQESQADVDLIVLPEICLGFTIYRMDCEAIIKMREIAARKKVYIVVTLFRYGDSDEVFNTSVLIDRNGDIAGIYDKAYPFWSEEHQDPPCVPGKDVPVFETDFGKLGISNCFDVNFPDVYKRLSDQGAELVLFPSGYSAGMCLQAHAINHNYYIVSSTLAPDCAMYDITGQEVHYQKGDNGINISRLTIDLDRCIFHFDLNTEKCDKLLKEHAGEIEMDTCFIREGYFTLRSLKPGVSAKKLASDYGMEALTAYRKRKRDELDGLRGFTLRDI